MQPIVNYILRSKDTPKANPPMKQKIFLVDDHPIIINGIVKILSLIPTVDVVGFCSNPNEAADQILNAKPDILIFDYQLPGTTGLEIFCSTRLAQASLMGICYTQHSEAWIVQKLINAKVNGIVLKSEDPEMLSHALRAISQKDVFYSPLVMKAVCNTYSQNQNFNITKREIEVLQLIAEELSSKEIAYRINLSVNTIEDYRKNLMAKLDVKNTAGLVLKASKMGIV